ncbi:hypothetical protein D3C78_1476360 [compost metagenome]
MRLRSRQPQANGEILDLQKPQHDEDQHQQRKPAEAVQAPRCALQNRQQPGDIEPVPDRPGYRYAMLFQPIHDSRISGLQAVGIHEQPLAQPAQSPGERGTDRDDEADRDDQRDQQRQKTRKPCLQGKLARPHDGDDEESEK